VLVSAYGRPTIFPGTLGKYAESLGTSFRPGWGHSFVRLVANLVEYLEKGGAPGPPRTGDLRFRKPTRGR
jgi:hypothetical protein